MSGNSPNTPQESVQFSKQTNRTPIESELNDYSAETASKSRPAFCAHAVANRLVSIVVPVMNEEDNVDALHSQICSAMDATGRPYELILVDDGSTDTTPNLLRNIAALDRRVKLILFRRNYGQTAAMQAGIDHASGGVIVTIDGDLQNDPQDIPMMLAKIDEGFDLVHGWRKNRQDAFINRKLPSKIANRLISKTTGFPIHDLGCTLKAIRTEIAQELELYGEMHRFIPILAHQRGAKCVEVVTRHHPRRAGTTKYGIGRTTRVILDLITVKYMLDYFASPMKLFGRIGLWCAGLAGIAASITAGMKVMGNFDITGNPLTLASMLLATASIQFLSLGLLGEVSARIYYGSQGKKHYAVRDRVNFNGQESTLTQEVNRRAA